MKHTQLAVRLYFTSEVGILIYDYIGYNLIGKLSPLASKARIIINSTLQVPYYSFTFF